MSVVDVAAYRMSCPDLDDATARIRSPAGLFIPTSNALPVGAPCIVDLHAPRTGQTTRVDAVVVSRRLPGGSGANLAPGVTLRASAVAEPVRSVSAIPAGATSELVRLLETLLQGAPAAFDVGSTVRPGERVRLTTGTLKWPGAVSFEALVGSCVRSGTVLRCVVTCTSDKDRRALATFVDRLRTALVARETSEGFRPWKPNAVVG